MSAWGTADMVEALPSVENVENTEAPAVVAVAPVAPSGPRVVHASGKTPQEYGWVSKSAFDYATYEKTSKELTEALKAAAENESGQPVKLEEVGIEGAVGGLRAGDWANNAAVYTWNDEYGDVGPRFEALEKQLFGSDYHVRSGIQFDKVIKVDVVQEGNVRIEPVRSFKDAGLHPVMLENVRLAGYDIPTPIQQYTLPAIHQGHDMVACAQTGSGKTAAFLIPILSKLMGKAKKLCAYRPNPVTFQAGVTQPVRAEPLVLIVAPSRELATQIFDEARRFCYRTMFRPCVVYGGGPIGEQIAQLAKGCDLLIGTPGRLVDFINRPHILTLRRLKYMVIDEADEMVGNDWETDLKAIMSGGDQEEGNITYMMFSATFPKMAREMAAQHLKHDHVRIRIGRAGSSHANIKQDIVFCTPPEKQKALFDLLMSTPPARTMIFVNSKRTADEVDDFLFNSDLPCTSIHSDRTQREREDSIRAFRSGKSPILITTGVAARGLDIHNVMHVINYDLPSPQYGGIEEYTHRIGRTGRIGNIGLATSFYNDRDSDLAEVLTKTLLETHQTIPDFLESYIPEGFTADGQGDVNLLKFELDDDDDAGDGEGGEDGGWGNSGTPAADPFASGTGDAWGAPAAPAAEVPLIPATPISAPVSGWPAAPAPAPQTQSAQGFGVQSAPVINSGFGAPPANSGFSAPTSNPGFGAPLANQGFSTSATNQGFGAPLANSGFGAPPVNPGFGAPPVNSGNGAPPTNKGFITSATNQGFGAPLANSGFGAPTANPGFGAPPVNSGNGAPPANKGLSTSATNQGFGAPPANSGIGAPTSNPGFGAPPTNPGYGAPTANQGFGAPPANSSFGAPAATPGFSAPTAHSGFSPPVPNPGFAVQPTRQPSIPTGNPVFGVQPTPAAASQVQSVANPWGAAPIAPSTQTPQQGQTWGQQPAKPVQPTASSWGNVPSQAPQAQSNPWGSNTGGGWSSGGSAW